MAKVSLPSRIPDSKISSLYYDQIIQPHHSQCTGVLVDLRKGPIERTIRSIVRLKAPDWNSSTKKNERKEFVYYYEDWTANDWLGIPLDPFSEHLEGKYRAASQYSLLQF